MIEPTRAPRRVPRYGWLVALGLVLAAGLGGLALAARLRGPRGAAPPAPHEVAELDTSEYLGPMETTRDAATGERTAPFSGFAVSVETDPPDAIVTVAGTVRGESPLLADVACRPGEPVRISVEKAGFRTARRKTTCRSDALVKLEVPLTRP